MPRNAKRKQTPLLTYWANNRSLRSCSGLPQAVYLSALKVGIASTTFAGGEIMRVQGSRLRLAIGIGVLGLGATIAFWNHRGSISQATASPPVAQEQGDRSSKPVAAVTPSESGQRAVAYIYNSVPVTREDLGEYLIARMGDERLKELVNLKIIQHYCEQKGIEISQAEIEAEFAETMKGIPNVTPKIFENKVLRPRNKTLYEWKEDVIKPRLMLVRLCRDRVQVTEDDVKKAFESHYGEKVECRMILWPDTEKDIAGQVARIRNDEQEFDRVARQQVTPSLAATGGMIEPIGHNATGNRDLEQAAFSLKPGELSGLIDTPQSKAVIKCVKRIPADPSKYTEAEREKLAREVFDKKVQGEISNLFKELLKEANPTFILKKGSSGGELVDEGKQDLQQATAESPIRQASAAMPSDYNQRAVAYICGSIPVSREELGEYLIARMSEDRLNSLVNLQIIRRYCKQKGIEVTSAEIEAEFAETLKGIPNVTSKTFEKTVLKPHHKTLYEWKEDVIKPRIMLSRLCRDRVHVTEDDIKMAFDAYHGEKVECRMILWPADQQHVAMQMYDKIRKSDSEFDKVAGTQASTSLASNKGKIEPIGHNTTGNPALERAAFSLKEGELSELIGTPQGHVVLKCVRRIPPDATKHIETEREKLAKEVYYKKVQLEIPKVFKELRDEAKPTFILKKGMTETELVNEVKQSLKPESNSRSQ
jgi:parvulin-like peptidyl-prolyl isomerase